MATPNSAIELHDSEVKAVTSEDGKITVRFSSAYIHKSDRNPGVEAGTGWTQAAELTFEAGQISGQLPELPSDIWEGDFKMEGADQLGLIPIPLGDCLIVELNLKFDTVHSVFIRGRKPKLILLGSPKFVENFPHANSTTAEQQ